MRIACFFCFVVIVLAATFLITHIESSISAHGGGIDANGGHNDRKSGGYHFHHGALAGQSFSSKSEALTALAEYRQENNEKTDPQTRSGASPDLLQRLERVEASVSRLQQRIAVLESKMN